MRFKLVKYILEYFIIFKYDWYNLLYPNILIYKYTIW